MACLALGLGRALKEDEGGIMVPGRRECRFLSRGVLGIMLVFFFSASSGDTAQTRLRRSRCTAGRARTTMWCCASPNLSLLEEGTHSPVIPLVPVATLISPRCVVMDTMVYTSRHRFWTARQRHVRRLTTLHCVRDHHRSWRRQRGRKTCCLSAWGWKCGVLDLRESTGSSTGDS